ncbi:hypothetical protein D3C78_945450 [compost metagenome]
MQSLLPLLLDQGDGAAPEAGLPAGEQPLTLLLRLLVVALQLVQQLVLALQPRLLGTQDRGQSGQLAAKLLPLILSVQILLAGLLPRQPLLATKPLAPGLGPHLLIETGLTLCQALTQGCLLFGQCLQLGLPLNLLPLRLLPLLLKLLMAGGQLAQLLAHGLQLLLAELGLTQLLLALGQPMLQSLATAKQGTHQLAPLGQGIGLILIQWQRVAQQLGTAELLPTQGQLFGAGIQLRQMLAARRQLACQLLAFALALDVLMIESLPLELEAAGSIRQLTQNARHLRLALTVGVLLGAAEGTRFTIVQDVAILLETGDGARLLQRVARLVSLQGEPLAGRRQLAAERGQPAQGLLQLGDLLLQTAMLLAVIATIISQLQQLMQLAQLFGLLLPLLLRLGKADLPLLLLQLVLLLLQSRLLLLPVVALLLSLRQPAGEIPQGMALVLAALQHAL